MAIEATRDVEEEEILEEAVEPDVSPDETEPVPEDEIIEEPDATPDTASFEAEAEDEVDEEVFEPDFSPDEPEETGEAPGEESGGWFGRLRSGMKRSRESVVGQLNAAIAEFRDEEDLEEFWSRSRRYSYPRMLGLLPRRSSLESWSKRRWKRI